MRIFLFFFISVHFCLSPRSYTSCLYPFPTTSTCVTNLSQQDSYRLNFCKNNVNRMEMGMQEREYIKRSMRASLVASAVRPLSCTISTLFCALEKRKRGM